MNKQIHEIQEMKFKLNDIKTGIVPEPYRQIVRGALTQLHTALVYSQIHITELDEDGHRYCPQCNSVTYPHIYEESGRQIPIRACIKCGWCQ